MTNVLINKEKHLVELYFNQILYNIESIEEACEAFQKISSSKITENGKIKVSLTLIDNTINIDTLGYEFFNYVFGLMKKTVGISLE